MSSTILNLSFMASGLRTSFWAAASTAATISGESLEPPSETPAMVAFRASDFRFLAGDRAAVGVGPSPTGAVVAISEDALPVPRFLKEP